MDKKVKVVKTGPDFSCCGCSLIIVAIIIYYIAKMWIQHEGFVLEYYTKPIQGEMLPTENPTQQR